MLYATPQEQLKYGALDALTTSYAFRRLRMLHMDGRPCSCCERAWSHVGSSKISQRELLRCGSPECRYHRKPFGSMGAMTDHMQASNHPPHYISSCCIQCGRPMLMPGPLLAAAKRSAAAAASMGAATDAGAAAHGSVDVGQDATMVGSSEAR